MTRSPALDGLRALAIGVVLLHHFWTYPAGWQAMNRLAGAGWIGVDLFFALSGFLITGILLRTTDQPPAVYFGHFYAKRILRIFPLYYATMAAIFLVAPLVMDLKPGVTDWSWWYIFHGSNIAIAITGWQMTMTDITWSLGIEEQFYALWPSAAKWLTRRNLALLCVGLLIACPLARYALWDPLGWRWVHLLTPLRLDAFAAGALVACVPVSRVLAGWVATGGLVVLTGAILGGLFGRESFGVNIFGLSLTSWTSAAIVVVAQPSQALTWRPLVHVGTVSYSLYLLHPMVWMGILLVGDPRHLTGMAGLDAALAVSIASGASLAVASVSYYVLERPILTLKDRLDTDTLRGWLSSLRWPVFESRCQECGRVTPASDLVPVAASGMATTAVCARCARD